MPKAPSSSPEGDCRLAAGVGDSDSNRRSDTKGNTDAKTGHINLVKNCREEKALFLLLFFPFF